jgi:hypothetical protein
MIQQLNFLGSCSTFDFNTTPPKDSTTRDTTMSSPMAPQYITGVYIPSAILIAGTAAFKLQWLPLAIAVCVALGGYQFFNNTRKARQSNLC